MPKVSVVMASYNHEKFVAETIQSVLDQTYQDFEFIITDDGSADRTVDIIKRFDDPRIKLFCFPQNHGACRTINNCINEAKGEYIAVINSDDAWFPNKLEKQVKFLDSHRDIGAVFSYAQIIDEDSNDLAEKNHAYQKIFIQDNKNKFEWLKHFFFLGNCLCHPSILIRKVCYEITGLYDERYAQLPDWDFWIRLCMRYDIHIMPENLTKFRVRANEANASGNRPETMTRFHLETTQVMRNYLNPLVTENFLKIFPLATNVPEAGVSIIIEQIETELIPFFLAKMALKIERTAPKSFGFDLLYQMCSNPEIAQKLKSKYAFDFNNLTSLASQQDIFGIVHVGELEARLQRKNAEISQIKEDKQGYWESVLNQLRELELLLEEYQTQLHQTEEVSAEYQSKRAEIESLLELSQSQLHQTESVLEECHTELKQEQTKVSQLEQYQQTLHHFVNDLRNQLYQVEDVLRGYKTELGEVEVIALNYNDKYLEAQTQLQEYQADKHEYQNKYLESQAELQKLKEQFDTQIDTEEKVIDELHQAEALLSEYETHIEEFEAIARNYEDKYLESHTQLQQAQIDANEYQNKYHKSENALHQYQTEIEQLKEQFHTSINEAEASIKNYQQQFKQTESILTDYQGRYEETQLELQKVRSHLHQKQTELKRYQFEHDQLIEKLSILDQQTKQDGEIITEKQEIIMQLEAVRNNIQQQAEQLELLLQEYQSHINGLEQPIGDLLSSKQDDANTYKQKLNKMHQNQVESEIALANYQSQLKASQLEIEQLKSWQTFNDSQVSEGGVSKYKTLVWQAWQAYNSGNYGQMANYLQQSFSHASLSRGQAIIDWVENFGRFASTQGTDLDTYSLTNLPEWQQLVRQAVRSSSAKLSILAGDNGIIPK